MALFVSVANGQRIPIVDIDNEMRSMLGLPIDERNFCMYFHIITNIGDYANLNGKWNQSNFNEIMKQVTELMEPHQAEQFKRVAFYFLRGKYSYTFK